MKTQHVLRLLYEARNAARMASARFSDTDGSDLVRLSTIGTVRTEPVDETKYIVERTKLFRESWVIAPLTRAIDEIEHEVERRKRNAAHRKGA